MVGPLLQEQEVVCLSPGWSINFIFLLIFLVIAVGVGWVRLSQQM